MKTRIISGIVMAAMVAGVLAAGLLLESLVITIFVAAAAAVGVYELVHNAAGIKHRVAYIGACIYAFLTVLFLDVRVYELLRLEHSAAITTAISVAYFLYAVVITLRLHKDFSLAKIAVLCAMPLFCSYAFSSLCSVINNQNGLYYLLLLLNFSSVCDMGAYFVGVTCGKHKLCPEISPKKTIEGAVGGIVSSVIFALVLIFCFGHTEKTVVTLVLTVPLCIVGMLGDLFASAIKRSVGLKDYGNLIPGHGGILDRVDSILMIAPLLYMFVLFGVI